MTDDNGRVTLALLGGKVDALVKQVETMVDKLEKLTDVKTDVARLQIGAESLRKDVDGLEVRVNGWSSLNSLGIVAAGILALFWKPK